MWPIVIHFKKSRGRQGKAFKILIVLPQGLFLLSVNLARNKRKIVKSSDG